MSPNAEKVRKWRKFMEEKLRIEEKVRMEMKKMRDAMGRANGYRGFQGIRQQYLKEKKEQ